MELPFTLGEVKWLAVGHPVEVVHPCPACNGSCKVTLVCGNGDEYIIDCEGCDMSTQGYRMGTIRQWEHTPTAERFVIGGVSSMHDGRWFVTRGYGPGVEYERLFDTEADALAAAQVEAQRHAERNMMFRVNSRKRAGAKATWTVRYGKDQIRKAEATIAWHTARMQKKVQGE